MDSTDKSRGFSRKVEQLLFDWRSPKPAGECRPLPSEAVSIDTPGSPVDASTQATPCPVRPSVLPESALASDASYGPGHPWHYYREGDNAPPIPFEDIPASEESARALERDLPKPGAKRIVKVRELLESERREIDEARDRYQTVIEQGAEALSRYDREIAYGGNDEMAKAGTLALLFNQVAWRKGRIARLEREQSHGAARNR